MRQIKISALYCGALLVCAGCKEGTTGHGEAPCWSCVEATSNDENTYDVSDLESRVVGHWQGEYTEEDAYGPLSIDIRIEAGRTPVFQRMSANAGCEVPADAEERCAGVELEAAANVEIEAVDWEGKAATLTVQGSTLSCAAPDQSEGFVPSGCPFLEIEASREREGQVMLVVFDDEGRLWSRFEGARSGTSDYVEIGQRIDE